MRLHLAFGHYNSVWSLETPIFRVMSRIQQRQPNGTVVRVCLIRLMQVRIHHSGPECSLEQVKLQRYVYFCFVGYTLWQGSHQSKA